MRRHCLSAQTLPDVPPAQPMSSQCDVRLSSSSRPRAFHVPKEEAAAVGLPASLALQIRSLPSSSSA